MNKRTQLATLAFLPLPLLALSLFSFAHPVPPPESQGNIAVRSELVQIDGTVTDKNGKRVGGLTAKNFQLFEDNQLQKLTAADYFDVPSAPPSPADNELDINLSSGNDRAVLNQIGNNHRLLVLFFDKTSMENGELLRAVDAAGKFAKDQMTSSDLVAIAVLDTELRITSSFTNAPKNVEDALKSVPLSYRQATNQSNAGGRSGYITDTEQRLGSVKDLAQILGQIPGRKSVIHFTGGLPPSGEWRAPLVAATNEANDNNLSFFEVDARAVMTTEPRIASGGGPVFPNPFAGQNAMNALAVDTGGRIFTETNDFAPVFKQIEELSTEYYLLSYASSNKLHDGRYRRVSVKLVDVPDGRATFRPGYLAPKN